MRRALVVGGSLAGMCAARALAEAFDEVVVVDRDAYPAEARSRPGVPQSRHAHALLERGHRELEALFPGFGDAMLAAGALCFDAGEQLAVRRAPGWQGHGVNGSRQLWSSRELLELTVRGLLRRTQRRVTFVERASAVALRTEGGPRPRATGVVLRHKNADQQELSADLVVDASGRSTRAESWLRTSGITPPVADIVDSHAGYASRLYRAPATRPETIWWKGLWIDAEPPHLARGGVIFPLENDRWLVTLSGIGEQAPPTDEAGFDGFMRRLSSPALAEAVSLATPLSDIFGSRQLENVRRRYDTWSPGLRGFVAVGDAACAFNPVYGQGISVAAMGGSLLRSMLRADEQLRADFEPRFAKKLARMVEQPWRLATGADFVWPGTQGKRPPRRPVIGTYVKLALQASHFDPDLRREIFPLFSLTGGMSLLFRPRFVTSVLTSTARRSVATALWGAAEIPSLPPPPGGERAPAPRDVGRADTRYVRSGARVR